MIFAALIPLIAQAALTPALTPTPTSDLPTMLPNTQTQERLSACLQLARSDPSTAIITASLWIAEARAAQRAYPHQCMGIAYTRLLRWEAAERAFLKAREVALPQSLGFRAKLAAMAGNSAMADGRHDTALADFDLALGDTAGATTSMTSGEVQIDRSRALVALGRLDEANEALSIARHDAPNNAEVWLLSATLARRGGEMADAQSQIETAAELDPENPAISLEAGLIAVLSGRDEIARQSWQSLLDTSPDSPEAEVAKTYLAQLAGAAE